jgi:hypothetical protein
VTAKEQALAERDKLIAGLVSQGIPADLAPRAADSWISLLSSAPALAEVFLSRDTFGWWLQYTFFRGFVAGSVLAVHHN